MSYSFILEKMDEDCFGERWEEEEEEGAQYYYYVVVQWTSDVYGICVM